MVAVNELIKLTDVLSGAQPDLSLSPSDAF